MSSMGNLSEPFFLLFFGKELIMKRKIATPTKDVIASRKSCDPKGTGLSHYILAANKKAK